MTSTSGSVPNPSRRREVSREPSARVAASFAELFKDPKAGARLCQALVRRFRDAGQSDAEDLGQDTILRALEAEACGRFDPQKGSPVAFLFGIQYRVLRQVRKSHSMQLKWVNLAYAENEYEEDPSPLDHLLDAELRDRLPQLIARLHKRDRALLKRRNYPNEVRRKKSKLTGSERARLSRLLKSLRKRLER